MLWVKKDFFQIWIIGFDISVSLDLGVKGTGSGQRTIARFEKSPDYLIIWDK